MGGKFVLLFPNFLLARKDTRVHDYTFTTEIAGAFNFDHLDLIKEGCAVID